MSYGNYAPFYRTGYFNPMQSQTPNMPNMTPDQGQYANPYQQPTQQPQIFPSQMSGTSAGQPNDRIWVQGEAGAKAYLIAPNATVTLWDSESPTIYIKSADANGIPSTQILDYTDRTLNAQKQPEKHVCQCGDKFIPIAELTAINGKFDNITDKIQSLELKIKELTEKPATRTAKTNKAEEENA